MSLLPRPVEDHEPVLRDWWESWRDTHYDLETRAIVVVGNPPEYAIRHEEAHRDQHRERSRLFVLWKRSARFPAVHRLAHWLLERDADRRARAVLRKRGPLPQLDELASRISRRSALCAFLGLR